MESDTEPFLLVSHENRTRKGRLDRSVRSPLHRHLEKSSNEKIAYSNLAYLFVMVPEHQLVS